MAESGRKYRREQPDARRESLVEAALRCLAAHGHDGVSVRRIAAEAGVSVGLINHHYSSIDELIAHAYDKVAVGILRQLREIVAAAPPTPRTRLSAFIRASFSELLLDPQLLSVWVVFWSMVKHSPIMQETQRRTSAAYREVLEADLATLAAAAGRPAEKARLAAIGLSALLDGLWLELSLNPSAFDPADGIAMCEEWVDRLAEPARP